MCCNVKPCNERPYLLNDGSMNEIIVHYELALTKKKNQVKVKTGSLRSYLKVFTGIKKKKLLEFFFYHGEIFLKIHFAR